MKKIKKKNYIQPDPMTTTLQVLNIQDTNKQYKPKGKITGAKRDKITPGFRPRTSSQAARQSRVEEAQTDRRGRDDRSRRSPNSESKSENCLQRDGKIILGATRHGA